MAKNKNSTNRKGRRDNPAMASSNHPKDVEGRGPDGGI